MLDFYYIKILASFQCFKNMIEMSILIKKYHSTFISHPLKCTMYAHFLLFVKFLSFVIPLVDGEEGSNFIFKRQVAISAILLLLLKVMDCY